MIRKLTSETWKPLQFPGWKQLRKKYALSSLGRVASYSEDVLTDGKLLNGSLTTGYKTLNLHRPGNNGERWDFAARGCEKEEHAADSDLTSQRC